MTKCQGFGNTTQGPSVLLQIVDGFGVKYVGEEYVQHLINVLEKFYVVNKDWTGKKYCGINLDWNYN